MMLKEVISMIQKIIEWNNSSGIISCIFNCNLIDYLSIKRTSLNENTNSTLRWCFPQLFNRENA